MAIKIPRFLRHLRDVVISAPADGEVLTYDGADGRWKNEVGVGGGGGGAPTDGDYLVGTTQGGLSAEIVVGLTPGGELGGTWAAPTIDTVHSGSSHGATRAAAEATAAAALADHVTDTSDAHDASAISSVAAGGLAATDVQAALNELDTEKTTLTSFNDHSARHENGGADEVSVAGLSGLLADGQTPIAHAASHQDGGSDELSITGLSGTPAALQSHLDDTSDAHNASAVSFIPAGTIAATDVQAAIEEVAAEAGGGGGGAPTDADYLVGTGNAGLSGEIVVGLTPGGELGGTWAAPTVDATHSGSSHASVQAAAEATAAAALTAHTGDASDAHDASAISSIPAGGLAATEVQAALNELDTEKVSTTTFNDHSARHENGGGDEISIAGLDGTSVELAAHLADAADAHDASAVSFVPTGPIAATNVQAAIAEVATDLVVGAVGGAISIPYTFDTSTVDGDPGAGKLRLNSATQNLSSQIFVDLLDSLGTDWTDALDSLDDADNTGDKGQIRLFNPNDLSKWIVTTISLVQTASGYRKISAAIIDSSGANPFANGDPVVLTFTRTGDQGQFAPFSAVWLFDSSTVAGDPGVGEFRLNADLGVDPLNVTAIYISDEDAVTGGTWGFVFTDLDAVDNPTKGLVSITRRDRPATDGHMVWRITNLTNNTGWWTITVAPAQQTASPPLAAGNRATIGFAFAGDQGGTGGTGTGGSTLDVAQTAHGLAVGNVIRLSGTNYVKAQANTESNAEAVGIVSAVADANNFTVQSSGFITGLSGLTAAAVYFLDDDTAGLLTTTEPADVGDISKPLLIAATTTSGWIENMRGFVVSAAAAADAPADATYLVTAAHANLSAEIVVGATPGGELGGTWAAPTVDATHSGSSHASIQAAAEATAAAALTAHTGDTSDAHDASAVSIVDAGSFYTGTDVEAALQEIAGGGGSGETIARAIAQTAHGLSVGNAVRLSGANYVKAQANSVANAEAVGIVSAVAGANNFTIVVSGWISTLSGLTAGTVYFLDDDTSGLLTATEPPDVGDVSKPMLVAATTTAGWVINMRGVVIAAAGSGGGAPDDATYLVATAHADLSAEVAVGATPGGELGGTWASPTVDATHSGSSHAAVQAAAEATAAAALAAHTGDTTDAHDASAISILDTANDFTATEVEGALAELQSDHEADATALSDHIADASAAHAASAVSASSATLSGTGTDVQAVLEELDNLLDDHSARHEDGGADEISVLGLAGLLADAQKITVRKNTGADVGTRTRLNFIEGANVTLTVADDAGGSEVDITIASSGGGGSGTDLSDAIAQTAHGLAVGNIIRHNGTAYVKAQANSAGNAEVVGIVSAVAGANDFTLCYAGLIEGLSGLTAGTIYYLDDDTAGLLTATEPTDVGDVSKPVFIAVSTTSGLFFNMRGVVIAAAGASGAPDDATYLVTTAHAGLSAEVAVGATPGGELGGTWAAPTVDATHSGSTHAAVQAAAEATAAAALSAHTGDATDAHDASAISVVSTTLSGTGTDVQAVFEEIDNLLDDHSARHENGGADEISIAGLDGTSTELAAHLADASAAHAASAVSVSSTTLSGTGTDAQAVFEELDNLLDDHSARHENGGADEISIAGLDGTPVELTNHLNDTADAHDASAISFSPTGSIAATDVQAAIAEVATEAGGGSGGPYGGAVAIPYLYNNSETNADPGTGFIAFSNTDPSTATALRCDLVDDNGDSVTDLLDSLDSFTTGAIKGLVRVSGTDNPEWWAVWSLTSVGGETGYRNLNVTYIDHSSGFALNTPVTLTFTPAGQQADLDTHLADAADAHDASAISVSDAGGLYTATDVEAALQEIRSQFRVVARTADSAAKTNNTLASDDTLLMAVSGNSADVWFFETFLFFNSANATMDIKVGWSVPSGTTMKWGYGYVAGSAGFPGSPASAASYAPTAPLGAGGTAVYATATTSDFFANAKGYIYVGGTAGNVVMQWAQNTTDAGNLILNKGSFIRFTKVI